MKTLVYLMFGLSVGYFFVAAFHSIAYLITQTAVEQTLDAIESSLIRFMFWLGIAVIVGFLSSINKE